VRERRVLEEVVMGEGSCLWVMKGGEIVVRSRMLGHGRHVGRGCRLTNPDVGKEDLAASGSTGCAITWIKEATFKSVDGGGVWVTRERKRIKVPRRITWHR